MDGSWLFEVWRLAASRWQTALLRQGLLRIQPGGFDRPSSHGLPLSWTTNEDAFATPRLQTGLYHSCQEFATIRDAGVLHLSAAPAGTLPCQLEGSKPDTRTAPLIRRLAFLFATSGAGVGSER